jgi:hypothetical protein
MEEYIADGTARLATGSSSLSTPRVWVGESERCSTLKPEQRNTAPVQQYALMKKTAKIIVQPQRNAYLRTGHRTNMAY